MYAMSCGRSKLKIHSPVCQGAYKQIIIWFDHFWTASKLGKYWVSKIYSKVNGSECKIICLIVFKFSLVSSK